MKYLSIIMIALILIGSSCKKENNLGEVTFWSDTYGFMTLQSAGTSGSWLGASTIPPTCGVGSGDYYYTFKSLLPGTYTYAASSTYTSSSWSGHYTITAGSCQLIDLNSSNSSGGSTGTLMFWENEQGYTCTVNVSDSSGKIIGSYPGNSALSPPACGSAGCYSITLPYGSYPYTASDGAHNWSGTATVNSECNTYILSW